MLMLYGRKYDRDTLQMWARNFLNMSSDERAQVVQWIQLTSNVPTSVIYTGVQAIAEGKGQGVLMR